MDNFYTMPDLLIDEETAACGTMQPRRGAPKDILQSSNNSVNIKLCHITIT